MPTKMFIVGILLFIICFVSVSSEKSEDYSSRDYGQNALKNLLLKYRKEAEERENSKVEKIGQECYHFDSKKCEYPDYWIHWTGTKCHYGNAQYVDVIARNKNGLGECGLLAWYFMWIWLALGVTIGLGILGCFCGPLWGSVSGKWCMAGMSIGAGIFCPFVSWPCINYVYHAYTEKHRCVFCQEYFRVSMFKFLDQSAEHSRILCLKTQSLTSSVPYRDPHSLVPPSAQGTSVPPSAPPSSVPSQAPYSSVPPPAPASNILPPGWQVMTNPLTGAPYALCDPSGKIQSLTPDNTINPPPYTEAIAYPPTQK